MNDVVLMYFLLLKQTSHIAQVDLNMLSLVLPLKNVRTFLPEAYLGLSKISMMELLAKIVDSF